MFADQVGLTALGMLRPKSRPKIVFGDRVLIQTIAQSLLQAPAMAQTMRQLAAQNDATLAVVQSARPLVVASVWAHDPRPMLFIVPGEETAQRATRALSSWLGVENVRHFPACTDFPWSDTPIDSAVVGARAEALWLLAQAKPCVVVASAHALMRRVPPVGVDWWAPSRFDVGDEVPFEEMGELLVGLGYADDQDVATPGTFHIRGDAVDVFPAQHTSPVRIEFFGDQIDRIRKMVASTRQTIADVDSVTVAACREIALTDKTITRARHALYNDAQEDSQIAADLELIEARSSAPHLDKYLPELYGGSASVFEHMSQETLVILSEPRALFDDCQRKEDELLAAASAARASTKGLFSDARQMDFGTQQRLSLSSILRTQDNSVQKLEARQPAVAGSHAKLINRVRQCVENNMQVVFAVPERSARESLELSFNDEHILFCERRASGASGGALGSSGASDEKPLQRGVVTFVDLPLPAGSVFPEAKLAVFSVADLTQRMAKHATHKQIDPTTVTFPFKPGDYVVHATHGIALFKDIVRQEVAGRMRDYFLLEYAHDDKLFVPLEQVNRLSRYVGPDGASPRLTRLNTADWSLATSKARKSAKKLAFDLVDLYTRRASVAGHACAPDTPAQHEMEASFPYELTADQTRALLDIKADMESTRPTDRLLCGDVGFGKTEVALRAAFKTVTDGRQVMILCPTTILAEQHFQTFFNRFVPFDVDVRVLSRFVTPAKQRRALEGFASGEVKVLVGTHRLLSSDVNPRDLGLIIIDEEQRFGVQHKEQLKNMREQVDVLTLSATPIPRTMQMAMSGVRDMSLILTPPPGRIPVKVQVSEYNLDTVSSAIRAELARKGQVYYVSNRVNTIDEAVERVMQAAPEARIGVAHGKMSARETEDVMMRFEAHEIDVLIATTIIESGIDNPHTNTLIIEDSQRLGLAQLYQLKGRVGRGRIQAYAYFMFPAASVLTPEAIDRLTAINEYQELGSGMRIAMRDLEIRGAGSLMGAEQHGNLSSVGFDLFTQMLSEAVSEAHGEQPLLAPTEVSINLPADFYLDADYIPDVDKRVVLYRQLASFTSLQQINELEAATEQRYGELLEAGRNLFDRARLRIRAQRLGATAISLSEGRLVYLGLEVSRVTAAALQKRGARVFVKSKKLTYPLHRADEDIVPAVLGLLEEIGGDDEE